MVEKTFRVRGIRETPTELFVDFEVSPQGSFREMDAVAVREARKYVKKNRIQLKSWAIANSPPDLPSGYSDFPWIRTVRFVLRRAG